MQDEPPVDPFLTQLCKGYNEAEVAEIEQYITWLSGMLLLISVYLKVF